MTIEIQGTSIALALLVAGCGASMTEQECRSANWYARGEEDARHPRPYAALRRYREACSEYHVTPDARAWETGRAAGLEHWVCSSEQGYAVGAKGSSYENDCRAIPRGEGRFLSGYVRGLQDRRSWLLGEVRQQHLGLDGFHGLPRDIVDSAERRSLTLQLELQRVQWLYLQVRPRLAYVVLDSSDDVGPSDGSPTHTLSAGDRALLGRLFAGDPGLEQAARSLVGSTDPAARRAASLRLATAAMTLRTASWRTEQRGRLEELAARRGFKATPEQYDTELDRLRDLHLTAVLTGMEDIGGPPVVAQCLDIAADESLPRPVRLAALGVMARHAAASDAATRSRGYALWERLNAPKTAEVAP